MTRILVMLAAVTLGVSVVASASDITLSIDLRNIDALEQVKKSNPAHFEKIEQILAGLLEQPKRVEADWLRTNFNAHNVQLHRGLIKTSYPPKQLLRFMLDDVRYTMYVIRSDLTPVVVPAM